MNNRVVSSHTPLNTSVNTPEVKAAFGEFMQAFEAFKDSNDERIAQLEKNNSADVVTEQKLSHINTVLDELGHKIHRPALAAQKESSPDKTQAKQAFDDYARKGDVSGLQALAKKSLSAGVEADGGYTVPNHTETTIMSSLRAVSPIREIASVQEVSSTQYKKPFALSGPETGWVGETEARPETASPVLDELSFPTMELYAMPAATATLLDDSAVNIDEWLASEIRLAFAEQESEAFVTGDGINRPKGFLSYTAVDENSWSWGNIGTVSTGADGAFEAGQPADALVDMIYALKAGYRANGRWVMNRSLQAEIRKMKDADGQYLWQPPAQPGGTSTLMHFPITESEHMPDMATDSTSIAFGDFERGYLIVDRIGIRVLRDPYSAKPYVLFYTTKRVGGGVQDFEAIKLLKFAA